jgi:hypothetical protein
MAVWVDTYDYSYVLTTVDDSYVKEWENLRRSWKPNNGKVPVYYDLEGSASEPRWWSKECKTTFPIFRKLIRQAEKKAAGGKRETEVHDRQSTAGPSSEGHRNDAGRRQDGRTGKADKQGKPEGHARSEGEDPGQDAHAADDGGKEKKTSGAKKSRASQKADTVMTEVSGVPGSSQVGIYCCNDLPNAR